MRKQIGVIMLILLLLGVICIGIVTAPFELDLHLYDNPRPPLPVEIPNLPQSATYTDWGLFFTEDLAGYGYDFVPFTYEITGECHGGLGLYPNDITWWEAADGSKGCIAIKAFMSAYGVEDIRLTAPSGGRCEGNSAPRAWSTKGTLRATSCQRYEGIRTGMLHVYYDIDEENYGLSFSRLYFNQVGIFSLAELAPICEEKYRPQWVNSLIALFFDRPGVPTQG